MVDIRPITADEVKLFRSRFRQTFGGDADPDETALERFNAVFELDRTVAAFDGDEMIGTGGGLSFGVTVPGGANVPMGGTTVISVQPTHRRRGVLRSIMSHHFENIRGRGEPLAGLWASESTIYGRFGYGLASHKYDTEIDAKAIRFRELPADGRVRLVNADKAGPIVRSIYDQVRSSRSGMLNRSDAWWEHRILADPESAREDKSQNRHLVFEEKGTPTGYAIYRQKGSWDDFIAHGEVAVTEVIATTSEAHTGIWSFLTNVDLFPRVTWWNMPLDDPLPMKVTDPRRVKRKLGDALWLRVMDIPQALEAREYTTDGTITFDVSDPTMPDNSGTYRLDVSAGNGACERVSVPAEVSFEVEVLGHLYLGGGDALAMADAGRIKGDHGAVTRMHRLMRWDQQPWCPEVF